MPHALQLAIRQSLQILTWQENLTKDEMPPEWMWLLDEDLVEHFDRVNEERAEKYGGGGSRDDDDDLGGMMVQNDLAKGRGRRAA